MHSIETFYFYSGLDGGMVNDLLWTTNLTALACVRFLFRTEVPGVSLVIPLYFSIFIPPPPPRFIRLTI